MRIRSRSLAAGLCVALLVAGAPARAGSPPEPAADDARSQAERWWRQRARAFADGSLDPQPVAAAIAAWRTALAEGPEDLEPRFRLIEALYFQGHFVESDGQAQRRLYDELIELVEETLARAEAEDCDVDRVRAHFWAAISWGLWAMSHGNVKAGLRGAAGKIRRHAQAVIDLDPRFADGGGLRLLGRLHTATPKVPLFTGWIDRENGIELLRRANAVSTRDARNPLFLAEALLEHRPEERDRALALLREVAARRPDAERLVEESEIIDQARQALERAGERP